MTDHVRFLGIMMVFCAAVTEAVHRWFGGGFVMATLTLMFLCLMVKCYRPEGR